MYGGALLVSKQQFDITLCLDLMNFLDTATAMEAELDIIPNVRWYA